MLISETRKRRELKILSKLDKLGIARVDQLMQVTDLGNGSRRNALRVLREMERDGLVVSWRIGAKLFAVKGKGFGFWEHTLLRNDFLLKKGLFSRARMEVPIKKNGEVVLRADVGVERVGGGGWKFYEIDRRQKKKDNLQKIQTYKDLGVAFEVVCYRDRVDMWSGVRKHIVEEWMQL